MRETIFDIKVYVEGSDLPHMFTSSIKNFRKRIYTEDSKVEGWSPIHRDSKPAVEYSDGGYEWWHNGYLHNLNGPAIHYPSTGEYFYYINGVRMNKDLFDILKVNQNTYKETTSGWIRLDNCSIKLKNGVLHSEDGPAMIYDDNTKVWFQNGALSRQNGPAIIWADGTKEYWVENKRDRCDYGFGPVVLSPDGKALKWCIGGEECTQQEYNDHIAQVLKPQFEGTTFSVSILSDRIVIQNADGENHRVNGPAVMRFNGDKEWYLNGKLHRVGGPAVSKSDGTLMWYEDNLRHRENGPAIEFANGRKVWYLEGARIRKTQYYNKLRDLKDKRELIEAIESMLGEFSEQIPKTSAETTSEEIQDLLGELHEVENIFADVLKDEGATVIKDDRIYKFMPHHEEVEDKTDAIPPINALTDVKDEMGWEVPAVSIAVAALLGLGKALKTRRTKSSKTKSVPAIEAPKVKEELVVEVATHGKRS